MKKAKVLIKVMEKEYYKNCKCKKCKTSIQSDKIFYRDKSYNYYCEDCIDENDYINLNTGYFSDKVGETFRFLHCVWNVEDMIKYAQSANLEVVSFSPKSFESWINSDFITIDNEHVEKVDTTIPGIIVDLKQGKKSSLLVVDGNHRIRKAHKEGLSEVKFYYFNFKDQLKFILGSDFEDMEMWIEKSLRA